MENESPFAAGSMLVLETSTDLFSAAYFNEGRCDELIEEEAGRGRNAKLFPVLEQLLKHQGRPDTLLVGLGPGSYTGVRLSIASIQALAMAWGTPWAGQCSLCGLGLETGWVVGDARQDRFYLARIEQFQLVGGIRVVKKDKATSLIDDYLSEGEPVFTTDKNPVVSGLETALPTADRLGNSCVDRHLPTNVSLEPIYLGSPFVTKPRKLQRILGDKPA